VLPSAKVRPLFGAAARAMIASISAGHGEVGRLLISRMISFVASLAAKLAMAATSLG
jgi:hypothetical protein